MPENWNPLDANKAKELSVSGGIKSADDKALATMTIISNEINAKKLLNYPPTIHQ